MTKLILISRLINPAKNSGAKKNLLRRGGVISDGDFARDDDSSSLSDRYGREKQRSRNRAKLAIRKILRRISKTSSSVDDDDGYESSSDASTGSTRSTSAAFLQYQNRKRWNVKLSKRIILQRLGDGSEKPLEDETMPWPIFDRTYKRQNQLLSKVVERESSDDDDSGLSDGDDDCPLAPPAPTFPFKCEETICEVDLECKTSPRKTSPKKSQSLIIVEKEGTDDHPNTVSCTADKTVHESLISIPPSSTSVDVRSEVVQESGIPTSESPKKTHSAASVTQHTETYEALSTPSLATRSTDSESFRDLSKPPQSAHPNLEEKRKPDQDIVPRSIPRTICYSLRSAIGDGSARQRNSHTLMEQRPLRPNGCAIDVSYWSHRGKRSYMEDRFVIEHIGSTSKIKTEAKPISLLAVFDGHGGSAASQFCSDWFSSYIRKKNDHYPHNLPMALQSAFTKIDSDFVSAGYFDGTTACAVTIVGKQVTCCNAGDSRAIIVKRDGSFVALSQDHKPDRHDESKRISDLGGRVIHWGRWRVEGVLAVSRSIGDAKMKPYVTAEPETVVHDIDNDDMFLVVASDGVWDTMSNDLVAKFVIVNTCRIVQKKLHVDQKLLRWIARQISKRARENGSSDNISCIVAHLKS